MEPAGRQQGSQVISFATTVTEPTQQSTAVEILSDYVQASNDASVPRVMPTPLAAQSQPQPSAKERSLTKAKRKKKR